MKRPRSYHFKGILALILLFVIKVFNSCSGCENTPNTIFEIIGTKLQIMDTTTWQVPSDTNGQLTKAKLGIGITNSTREITLLRTIQSSSAYLAYALEDCDLGRTIVADDVEKLDILFLNPSSQSAILATRHFKVLGQQNEGDNLENYFENRVSSQTFSGYFIYPIGPEKIPDTTQIVARTTLISGIEFSDTSEILIFN